MTAKKTTTVKAPPKPKFGEVGYTFPVMAKIIEVNPLDDDINYPFIVEVDMGDYDDFVNMGDGVIHYQYTSSEDVLSVVSKTVPSIKKEMLKDQIAKAKDKVKAATEVLAKLEKELASAK